MIGTLPAPPNATKLERELANATDFADRVQPGISRIPNWKYDNPPAALWPYLIFEWGLQGLTPFVANIPQLLAEGRRLLTKAGTKQAFIDGQALVGYSSGLEEASPYRRKWNRFQAVLGRVRDAEVPDLGRIEGIANFLAPARSRMVRGFAGYDVRASRFSRSKFSRSLFNDDSGVTIREGGAKWSFGRNHDNDHSLTQTELQALGIWIAPSTETFTWSNMNWPWSFAQWAWGQPVNAVRVQVMVARLAGMSCWATFKRADGSVIGHRKARIISPAAANVDGKLTVGNNHFALTDAPATLLYVEALTGFGEGDGNAAASFELRFGASPTDPEKPGALWCTAGGLTTPLPAVASLTHAIPFGRTVRERVRSILRFT